MDSKFAYKVVKLIIDGNVEDALMELSGYYGVPTPRVRIGRVKGKSKVTAVYVARRREIVIQDAANIIIPWLFCMSFIIILGMLEVSIGGRRKERMNLL